MKLLTVELFYVIVGLILALVAARTALDRSHPRRFGTALFWGLLAAVFVWGGVMPPAMVGYIVLALVILAAARQVTRSAEGSSTPRERAAEAERLQNRLFWPALLIPATAIAGSLVLDKVHVGDVWLADPKHATLIFLGLGALLAVAVGLRLTGARISEPVQEGGRLLHTIGWALLLPQMLAALGGIFAHAGVGIVVADLVARALPTQFPFVAVAAYCLGMALFTICMGNAFAAFAVITGGIGLPLIVVQHGGNPAIMGAVGMLAGYCGTLLTPMAANFNIVPAMLLELRDKNAVIKAQAPMAAAIWLFNVALMYLCVYRF